MGDLAFDLSGIIARLQNCPCGREHTLPIREVAIGSGVLQRAGTILKNAGIGPSLHVVADQNTLHAADGLLEVLQRAGFSVSLTLYTDLQKADLTDVERIKLEAAGVDAILAVGTGSIGDICRYAGYQTGQPFVLFATAPSMDGFASNMAPITANGFKRTYPAAPPAVILGDADILAAAPTELKAAGLGDLLGKFTARADWEIATLVSGEYFCDRVAVLTMEAVQKAVGLAAGIQSGSTESALALMEALVLSGLAMLVSGSTRPASGSEHHVAHFWEMKYAVEGRPQVFHGKKVGIAGALVADVYHKLRQVPQIRIKPHVLDTAALQRIFGPLWAECEKENVPDPLDAVDAEVLQKNWPRIRGILAQIPTGDEIRSLLAASGGAPDYQSAGIPEQLAKDGLRYGWCSRFRITMMRLLGMIDLDWAVISPWN